MSQIAAVLKNRPLSTDIKSDCNASEDASKVIERFKMLYEQLNASNSQSSLIDEVYRHDMVFQDSFHRIDGTQAFKEYCSSLYENLTSCNFVFHKEWLSDEGAMLTWTMHYAHPRLNGGKVIHVDGATELRFDDKVYFHKDYFDGGALLYEHIPLLGRVINQLKKRLS